MADITASKGARAPRQSKQTASTSPDVLDSLLSRIKTLELEREVSHISASEDAAQAAANRKTEVLYERLHHLTEIVKLAAFAVETQRTLTAIYGVMPFVPNMKEAIKNSAVHVNNWKALENNTGDVLAHVAFELASVKEDLLGHADSLASPNEAEYCQGTDGAFPGKAHS